MLSYESLATTAETSNSHKLHCLRCPCLILRPALATKVIIEDSKLPPLKKDAQETNTVFYRVTDMMAFDNIGFSRPAVSGEKYLLCADCELGPLGFQGVDENGSVCFNIAADRVRYAE
jgi:guanine nucleotide exchange factor